jgi:hypothetical protein
VSRKKIDRPLGELRILMEQLPPMKALEIFPEVLLILTPVLSGLQNIEGLSKGKELTLGDVIALTPSISGSARAAAEGRLFRLAPPLLSTTTVIGPDPSGKAGALTKHELSDARNIDVGLDSIVQILTLCWWSVEVTYKSFLDEVVRAARAVPAPSP